MIKPQQLIKKEHFVLIDKEHIHVQYHDIINVRPWGILLTWEILRNKQTSTKLSLKTKV